uniref:60S ribosomal protein L34 n=1 Tax=Phaeomonas parva TaxID=124430 RepID=A0A7S1XUC3_9STRA|mmetsp:Transcript_33797/g.106759  ORF Transcript_33797/g.106759 Transcript_33797/m.106759 type:complete len:118 (+) Transcript_33797:304-657(+)|eukprot:CAMPEP_0118879676 /NCGR_PEP_ID=MMETSP1163-20130328/19421_1 /TAXON_ID=124430 /ORGANISM="Phaeomonas parva, Strain CCMP2877" /LENGTH=117 /DNA_ID=CAMNT_0006815887 /DNA_START=183 /DNA_END=536 /DNA_ORIENTATION=-
MTKDHRVTNPRRHAYRTLSNKVKAVKTPGGSLKAHYHRKKPASVKCGDCGTALPGLKALRPIAMKRASKCRRTVKRAYGGSRCAHCVRQRVLRAFLIEEQKIVKKMLAEKMRASKEA